MRPSYKGSLYWIVNNDDTEFLLEEGSALSVTASLVADQFGKTDEKVWADLWKLAVKEGKYDANRR